jgi:hypothetical protein
MFKICKFANYQLGTFSNQEELIKYKIVNQIFYHKNANNTYLILLQSS